MKRLLLILVVLLSCLAMLVNSAALRPARSEGKRAEGKENQYPWYYWNQEGQQGQYPPYYYYQRCAAEGIPSLNLVSLIVVGMVALAFASLPQDSELQLKKTM